MPFQTKLASKVFVSSLHAESRSALFLGRLTLHLLADLDVDLKELGDAAVEAD